MSSEERVLDMMAQLDEHSEKIPEGMYLQFCDHLKFFYQKDENKKRLELLELQRQLAVEVVGRLAAETRRRPVIERQAIQVEEGRRNMFIDDEEREVVLREAEQRVLAVEVERLVAETRRRPVIERQAIQVEEGRRNMFIDDEEREVVLREAEQRVLRRKVRGRRGENQRRGNMFIDDDLGEEQRDEEQDEMVALFARPPGPRRCGCCRQLGHNRRTCPQRVQ
jgi:hypothetical protein